MRFPLAILLTIAISGCAVYAPKKDFLGHEIPPQCEDVSGIYLPVEEVNQAWLDKAAGGDTGGLYGLWSRIHVAYVREGLSERTRALTIEHEKRHECMWRLTGDPRWHSGHQW